MCSQTVDHADVCVDDFFSKLFFLYDEWWVLGRQVGAHECGEYSDDFVCKKHSSSCFCQCLCEKKVLQKLEQHQNKKRKSPFPPSHNSSLLRARCAVATLLNHLHVVANDSE